MNIQVNINLKGDDAKILDQMMVEDAYDNRSAFIRRLIRQEWARRYSQPNAGVTIEQAQAANENEN